MNITHSEKQCGDEMFDRTGQRVRCSCGRWYEAGSGLPPILAGRVLPRGRARFAHWAEVRPRVKWLDYKLVIAAPYGELPPNQFHGVVRDEDAVDGWLWKRRRTIVFSCLCGMSGSMTASAWFDGLDDMFRDMADKHEKEGAMS